MTSKQFKSTDQSVPYFPKTLVKRALTGAICALFITMNPAQAAQIYGSVFTQPINGFMPYFPSVGTQLFQVAGGGKPYLASENGDQKAVIKIGDTLRVPTNLQEAAYNQYYSWADADGAGQYSDQEDKANINLSVEWYLLEQGETTINPGVNARLLTATDGVSTATGTTATNSQGPGYTVGIIALDKQIGFRIKAYSTRGVPNEGVYLDVPNVAYLGKQVIDPTDPSIPPQTVVPDEQAQHPDIENKPVAPGADYIVEVIDLKTNQLIGNNLAYVNREYQAVIKVLNADKTAYEDKTEEYKKYLTWSIYSGNSAAGFQSQVEHMTYQGLMQLTGDLEAFDPDKATFTADAKVQARFTRQDNTVFKTQDVNENTLDQLLNLPPHFSDQGLVLKVNLILPNESKEQ